MIGKGEGEEVQVVLGTEEKTAASRLAARAALGRGAATLNLVATAEGRQVRVRE